MLFLSTLVTVPWCLPSEVAYACGYLTSASLCFASAHALLCGPDVLICFLHWSRWYGERSEKERFDAINQAGDARFPGRMSHSARSAFESNVQSFPKEEVNQYGGSMNEMSSCKRDGQALGSSSVCSTLLTNLRWIRSSAFYHVYFDEGTAVTEIVIAVDHVVFAHRLATSVAWVSHCEISLSLVFPNNL